jgi:hypothetical protein
MEQLITSTETALRQSWDQLQTKDFGWVSGRPDSCILRAEIPAIPAMRARVWAPELQKVCRILGGIPGESGI